MQKPDLNQMWETFTRFSRDGVSSGKHIEIIRKKVYPVIFSLKDKGIINWYCFLIHDGNEVPSADDNSYFHIRFALIKDVNPKDFLPEYCV